MKIKLSKTQWQNIGKTSGWTKLAGPYDTTTGYSGKDLYHDILKKQKYESLNDAAKVDEKLAYGPTKIWYWYEQNAKDFLFGDFSKISPDDLSKTHAMLGSIKETNPETIFYIMQGEYWSPNGEANDFIRSSLTGHTSMSVGDIVETEGKVLVVDRAGFKRIK